MPRVLSTVDEAAKEWVESQSDSLGVPEAEIIRRLIDAGQVDESLIESKPNHDSQTDSFGESELIHRLDELEQRVAALEAPGEETPDRSDHQDDAAHARNAESGDTRPESDTLGEDVREYLEREDVPPKTEHGRSAVVDVFRYLGEHGTTKTGEIQDAVYPDYTEEWGSARTMWNALDRYLPDVPGIQKGGYGEWEYTGDDTVRDQLEL